VKRSPTRRSFLRAVGAGATALPFYGLLEDSVARAAGETIPLRFAGIYHPHGVAAELFVMQSGDTESNFNLTYTSNGAQCALQPFDDAATYGKSFKNKIIAIEGIDLMSNANGHSTAGTILTGSYIDGTKPKNSSLDQFLAVEKKLGAATKVLVRAGRGGPAEAHRSAEGVGHAVLGLRRDERPQHRGRRGAPQAAGQERGRLRDRRRQTPERPPRDHREAEAAAAPRLDERPVEAV
jgi:hypothetical protein